MRALLFLRKYLSSVMVLSLSFLVGFLMGCSSIQQEAPRSTIIADQNNTPKASPFFLRTSTASKQESVAASPKKPWGEFTIYEQSTPRTPWWSHVLLWIPNRMLDAIDVIHFDVGAGAGYGGVVRLSKYAQGGYRSISPNSVRVGLFGRRVPVLLERSSEYGLSPNFTPSKERPLCNGEVGAGVDLIVGIHASVCLDELLDFVAGVFFLDVMDDDVK